MTNEEMRLALNGEVSYLYKMADKLSSFAENIKRTAMNDVSFSCIEESKEISKMSRTLSQSCKKVLATLKRRGKSRMKEISR